MCNIAAPPGKKFGIVLPRVSRYGQVCGLLSEHIDVIPKEEWAGLIPEAPNLRSHVDDILDQDGVGSCATEATAQSVMILRSWQNQQHVDLNPWSIYCFTSGGWDQGSNIDTNLVQARDVGILPTSIWPRSKGWRTKPPRALLEAEAVKYRIDEFYDLGTVAEVGTALLLGFPVVFGWKGHSCVLDRLLDPETAEYANSWDESWGDDGFGTIKLRSINFGYGLFAVRTVMEG